MDTTSPIRTVKSSAWRPLRIPIFRRLLLADLVSDIGAFMQSVGAAWMMVSFGAGPTFVALTQTASALPFFLLAPIAGSVGDVVDRRKLVLFTETWMIVVALAIALLTISGAMTPWLLLALTFALSAGDAFEAPSWRAILPELVPKEDLAAASALNGIEFNLARSLGPALAGIVIAAAGVAVAFVSNVVSFIGVLVVIALWKRPTRKRSAPPEQLAGAITAGLRYVRFSPEIKTVMLRQAASMFFASGLLALLPSIAHDVSKSAIGYGLLLGVFGGGAIVGALVMPSLRARWSVETVVSAGVVTVGAAMVVSGSLHSLSGLAAVLLIAGTAWICFVSLIGALMQLITPDWVRARVLAMFLLVFQGSVAAGSAFWGTVAQRAGIPVALHWAGLGAMASVVLALWFRLPDAPPDLSPWVHWRAPVVMDDVTAAPEVGPVLVTVEYRVPAERQKEFEKLLDRYGRVRRRDGASRWGIFRDMGSDDRYLEVFMVGSWAEHLRQHERLTRADEELENKIRECVGGDPAVRQLLYVAG
jgi:MFS family permease